MKNVIFLFAILFAAGLTNSRAQDTWEQKNDLGYSAMNVPEPTPRSGAVGFSIGTKGYVGTGYDNSGHYTNDFWEYDPVTNVWTQKAYFAGVGREGAVGFSIGSKGYLGTGSYYTDEGEYYSHYEYLKDFWEYDPAANTWKKRASFGGHSRTDACSFSLNGKGYIGTGYFESSNDYYYNYPTYYNDFWEYDPSSNTWVQKANYSGIGRMSAVGFSIGTKGYIGTGANEEYTPQKDFWEFDPDANSWTQKIDFGGTARSESVGFNVGNKGYIGTGYDGISPTYYTKDFWEYDPASDEWIQKADFGGTARSNAVGFMIGSKGYIGTSYGTKDFWEYDADVNAWTEKAEFGGTARGGAVGFSIGNKGYIGTGSDWGDLKDFWEFNPDENTWSQKADFAGTGRSGAVGFSIGNKGYIGTGYNYGTYFKDFWEYDPNNNTWTEKAEFGGTARLGAVGFSIGSKGYIGTGGATDGSKKDFWEYDPDADSWSEKADLGGTARSGAVGFSIGSKGYIGMGSGYQKDFWEYEPLTDSWTQKTDFGGDGRPSAIGFSIGSNGYVGTGGYYYFNWIGCFCYTYYYYNDFWEYTPSTNNWTQKALFPGTERTDALGFSIGDKGYIGTGFNEDEGYEKDFWEYTPEPCYGVTVYADADGDSYGDLTNSYFAANCLAPAGYVYDSSDCNDGNIAIHPTVIEICNSIDDNCDGIIDNNVFPPPIIIASGPLAFCDGDSVILSVQTGDYSGYSWTPGGENTSVITATAFGSYSVIVTDEDGCTNTSAPIIIVQTDSTFYLDSDGDGYGNPGASLFHCGKPDGYVKDNTDCNDSDASIHPGLAETAGDGTDNNCNGLVDESVQLWGLAYSGAGDGLGSVFKLNSNGSDFTVAHSFEAYIPGANPSDPVQASDGLLYGMTAYGGSGGNGVIFQYDPVTGVYTKKYDFDNTNGANPFGSFIQTSDGTLYGMTLQGGSNYVGVIFQYDPLTGVYTKKYDFDNTNGGNPYGKMMQASDGKLYGMTNQGGSNYVGVIFQYDPVTNVYTKKYDFDYANGSSPRGNLMQASDGKLYGMTYQGGSNGYGVIFQYDPASGSFTKKYDFDYTKGAYPQGSLKQATDGKLCGFTSQGGSNGVGVIFQYNSITGTYTKKYDFTSTSGGYYPYGNPLQTSDGKFYGITSQGGSHGVGLIFQYDPLNGAYTEKYDFDYDLNGGYSSSTLIQLSTGELYGTTPQSSTSGGVLFEFDESIDSVFNKIYFNQCEAAHPNGSLVKATNGILYGMTSEGGSNSVGVIFQYDPATGVYANKYDFEQNNGAYPQGTLIQASNGMLYGMASSGGTNNAGAIFQYNPLTGVYTKKYDFDYTNGSYPTGNLMQASDGNLYGMTRGGGVIFQYDLTSDVYTKKYSIGGYPSGSFIQALDGKLYGMTESSGYYSRGVIFQYDPTTSVYSTKYDFDYYNGDTPSGSLLLASDGKMYGMTNYGGTEGYGVIFQFDPITSAYTIKYHFDNTNGGYPNGSLIQASDAKLYGMTSSGGSNGYGVIFQYDPALSTFTVTRSLSVEDGINPQGDLLEISILASACAVPANLSVTKITSSSAKLKWDAVAGAEGYTVRYKVANTSEWKYGTTYNTSKPIGGLLSNTVYKWEVRAYCQIAPPYITSEWSSKQEFTTGSLRIGDESLQQTSFQIYPNPSKDHATIQFTLPQSSHICISVYDVSGREIATLMDEDVEQGDYSLLLNTNHFPKGVYLVKMISDFGIENQKLIVQ